MLEFPIFTVDLVMKFIDLKVYLKMYKRIKMYKIWSYLKEAYVMFSCHIYHYYCIAHCQ